MGFSSLQKHLKHLRPAGLSPQFSIQTGRPPTCLVKIFIMFLMLLSSMLTSILDRVNSITQTLQPVSVSLKWAQWKVQSTYRQTPFFAVCWYCIFKTCQWKAQSCYFGGCAISLRGAETAKKWRARKSHMFLFLIQAEQQHQQQQQQEH